LDAQGRDIGVYADGEIIRRHFQHIAPYLGGIMGIVGQRLGIGEQQILPMAVPQRDAVAQRSDIVAEVQRAGGAVARQYDGTIGGEIGSAATGVDIDIGLFAREEPPHMSDCWNDRPCPPSAAAES
jgi:hypothetical protein